MELIASGKIDLNRLITGTEKLQIRCAERDQNYVEYGLRYLPHDLTGLGT